MNVEVDVYLDVDVGVCLGGDDVVLDRLLRDSRTVIIPAAIVIIIILNTPHCHLHRDHSHGSQDNDLSLSQATELLRVVTARSQELQLPLVVAILDRWSGGGGDEGSDVGDDLHDVITSRHAMRMLMMILMLLLNIMTPDRHAIRWVRSR